MDTSEQLRIAADLWLYLENISTRTESKFYTHPTVITEHGGKPEFIYFVCKTDFIHGTLYIVTKAGKSISRDPEHSALIRARLKDGRFLRDRFFKTEDITQDWANEVMAQTKAVVENLGGFL